MKVIQNETCTQQHAYLLLRRIKTERNAIYDGRIIPKYTFGESMSYFYMRM